MAFTIAIVGRPNVGKSTLFNRLVGKRVALVDDQPGVTRDRREGEGRLGDLEFRVIDTAGLEDGDAQSLSQRMKAQTQAALEQADLALMMIDARAGITPMDRHFCDWLRGLGRPCVLVANKAEAASAQAGVLEAYELGLGEPVAIAAEHGEGMSELYQAIFAHMESDDENQREVAAESENTALKLAIVGRPNAGKSTLINKLIGEDRLVVGPEAGITRDSIAIDWQWQGRDIRLFDTAGQRRRARVQGKLEKLSVADARRAVQFAEVVVLLLDATLGIESQDLKIAAEIIEEGRALILALNKWDLVEDRQATYQDARDVLQRSFAQVKNIKLLTLSAETGQGLDKLMPAVFEIYELWNQRIPTARLNRWLADALDDQPPPSVKGRRLKLRYVSQIKTRPPTFMLSVNKPEALPNSYKRYLAHSLVHTFGFEGIAPRLIFKGSDNPFAA